MPMKRRVNKVVTKPKRKAPRNVVEWNRLLKLALSRADTVKDRRAAGLRKAIPQGKAELLLRKMGIVCESDIAREFPNK